MDLKSLGIPCPDDAATETVATITPTGADGLPITLANGEILQFDLILPNTPHGRREVRKWLLQTGANKELPDLSDADEATLDAAADKESRKEVDLAARVVAGWNLVDAKSKAVPCTLENRRAFFGHYVALRGDTIMQMNEQVAALGNGKKP